MKKFESGVKWYTTGQAVVDIYFPEDDICCKWCPFCRSESDLGRFWCRLNNKMIYNPFTGIGDNCPIDFESEEK